MRTTAGKADRERRWFLACVVEVRLRHQDRRFNLRWPQPGGSGTRLPVCEQVYPVAVIVVDCREF